jgi:hypothetical protein
MAATSATAVSAEALRKRYPGSDEFDLAGTAAP